MNVHLVDDDNSVSAFMAWLKAPGPIAIDTETCGLNWWEPGFLRLVQFGRSDGSGWAVPYGWHPRLLHHALEWVRCSGEQVIFHNAKFDMHALDAGDLPLPKWQHVHDTQILHHLDDPLARHGLKPISVQVWGPEAGYGQAMLHQLMNKHGWKWGTVPVDHPVYWGYGVIDTILTAMLFEKLDHQSVSVAYDREMSYQRIMYGAECRGIRIDTEYSRELRDNWSYDVEQLRHELQALGIENPNSNRQVEQALRAHGWEPSEYTETGQALLDKGVLADLGDYPHVAPLIEYKQKTKWISTYLDPFVSSGGRVHPSIHTMAAITGRSSITSPPLQTLPHTPEIRRAVLPEEGCSLYAIDYSGQEYRILAALSKDPAWTEEFLHGAADPHQMVADQIGTDRGRAKNANFAKVYGAGMEKLSSMMGLTIPQVERFLKQYDNRFPGIERFKRNLENLTYRNDCKATTGGGRTVQCHSPDQLYAITNYVIQGSGADVLKEAACQLDAAGLADYIMVPVHDELVFSLPEGVDDQEIADIMTNTDWYDIPLVAESEGPFENWGSKYEVHS